MLAQARAAGVLLHAGEELVMLGSLKVTRINDRNFRDLMIHLHQDDYPKAAR